MSGNEGTDYRIGSGSGGVSDCQGLVRDKPLQAPEPETVETLEIDDLLSLRLEDGEYPKVAAVTDTGSRAGYVMPDNQLIQCMQLGIRYIARVTRISGGSVMLHISAGL